MTEQDDYCWIIFPILKTYAVIHHLKHLMQVESDEYTACIILKIYQKLHFTWSFE